MFNFKHSRHAQPRSACKAELSLKVERKGLLADAFESG
ncbi:MAG: hypothetical protein BSOLF_2679 [Candidatus Carbobacillus altaicus]|uniref:Uncharacterized protein n=1 Tax=Candidatus Carbonibacillus altaicus TaxID=2163959 RepID=A0A2R6Y2A9_9BACL|nr:MAG: hypothetical protein BSOLF_2679 [Candidatus Carbobacillus altaicus]